MVDALPKRRAISKITRHHSDIAGGPSLVGSFLREERILTKKIKRIDAEKNHLISHLENEIGYFRKACHQEMFEISEDDFEMSLISEDGSNVSNLKAILGEDHEPLNSFQKAGIKPYAGKKSDKIDIPLQSCRKAFHHVQGDSQEDCNGSPTNSHGFHLKLSPSPLHRHQLQRHYKYGGQHTLAVSPQGKDKNHHFALKEFEEHRSHCHRPCSADNEIRKKSCQIPTLRSSIRHSGQRSVNHVRKEIQSQEIGIDINDLATKSRNSPIFVRKSFPCHSNASNALPNTTSESLLLRHNHTLHFGLDFLPIKNNTSYTADNGTLNPMLFHPSFNNMTEVPEEDQNSFQVLKKCRYLRIPLRHLSESIVD